MKKYNYSLLPLLAIIGCKIIDKYFIGIFINDVADTTKYELKNKLYVLLESSSTNEFVKYFDTIILNSESLIRYYSVDVGYIMCVFEFPSKYLPDYSNIINGNYKNLSKEFKEATTRYFNNWENILDTKKTSVFDVKDLVIKIANNSPELLEDYWTQNCDDIEWLKTIMDSNGNYWSIPEPDLLNFDIDYLYKWKE